MQTILIVLPFSYFPFIFFYFFTWSAIFSLLRHQQALNKDLVFWLFLLLLSNLYLPTWQARIQADERISDLKPEITLMRNLYSHNSHSVTQIKLVYFRFAQRLLFTYTLLSIGSSALLSTWTDLNRYFIFDWNRIPITPRCLVFWYW